MRGVGWTGGQDSTSKGEGESTGSWRREGGKRDTKGAPPQPLINLVDKMSEILLYLGCRRQLSIVESTRAGGNKAWLLSCAVTPLMKYLTELWPLGLS